MKKLPNQPLKKVQNLVQEMVQKNSPKSSPKVQGSNGPVHILPYACKLGLQLTEVVLFRQVNVANQFQK